MAWDSWSAFWDMGGYGLYVWAAYIVALLVVVSEILVLVLSRRSILDHLGLSRRRRPSRMGEGDAASGEPPEADRPEGGA